MKQIGMLLIGIMLVTAATPSFAAAPKRTKQQCMDLAAQRGFRSGNMNENNARRNFVASCMKGQQN